jgi:hypothetical protein
MFWLAMFREAAETGGSIIFTFTPDATVGPDFLDLARKTVEDIGGEYIAIRFTRSLDQQERRIANADRSNSGKLRSVVLLCELRQQFIECAAAMPSAALTVDTSLVEPPMPLG